MTPFDDLIGHFATLALRRIGGPGAFLAEKTDHPGPDDPTLLLLGKEIPEGAKEGDDLRVFVYLDSEGRPLATTSVPKLTLGEVAFLKVTAVSDFGAFVDFGLPKELLVPFPEQTTRLVVGARHPIALYRDASGRLAGTMRVSDRLDTRALRLARDQWVQGEAWRNDPDIGLFVIIERRGVGLVPKSEPHSLKRGESARFRVTTVLPDGKVELSLRGHAHEELEQDSRKILAALAAPGAAPIRDGASPEEVRERFGLSRKAFKRAVGRLLKQGLVRIGPSDVLELSRK
ncbi:MAG TPA: S1-like domain-containing RNA-binding protein [Polyangiaceae bacterium]|nr:S1-like domain-containing RNA-binding protein [Polyangiaceae bacterium]